MNIKNKMKQQTSKNQTLSHLAIGQKGILMEPTMAGAEILRLLEMGMVKGSEITLLRRGPFGSPLHFAVCGTHLCLREQEASLFCIQPLN